MNRADETGIVLPYEKDAMAGMEMPDGLSYPDQVLYLELRLLYRQYYQKIIDRETAVKEKKKMIEQYKDLKFREKMGDHWVEDNKLLTAFLLPSATRRLWGKIHLERKDC